MNPFEQAFMFLKNDVLQNLIADKILEEYGPEEGMERLKDVPRQMGTLPFDRLANLYNYVLKPEGAEKFPSLLHGLAAREAESNEEALPSERMDEEVEANLNMLIHRPFNDSGEVNILNPDRDIDYDRVMDIRQNLSDFRMSDRGEELEGNLARRQKMNRIKDIIGESRTPMKLPTDDIQDRMQLEELRGSEVPAQMAQQKMGIAPGDLSLEQFEQRFPIDQDIGMSKVGVAQPHEIEEYEKPFEGLGSLFG